MSKSKNFMTWGPVEPADRVSAIDYMVTVPVGPLNETTYPYLSAMCTDCMHEWQQVDKQAEKCDWCGAPGQILAG